MIRVRTVLNGWPGAPGLHTAYFLEDGTAPATVAEEAFARVHAFWEDMESLFPPAFTATQDQVVDEIDSTTGDLINSHAVTTANVSTGSNGTPFFQAAQTMAFIRYKTGVVVGTRRLRGGSYIGPMAQGATNAQGQIASAVQAELAAAATAMWQDLPSGGFQAVWHRPSPGPGTTDGEAHPIVDSFVGPVWAHLTSRRR